MSRQTSQKNGCHRQTDSHKDCDKDDRSRPVSKNETMDWRSFLRSIMNNAPKHQQDDAEIKNRKDAGQSEENLKSVIGVVDDSKNQVARLSAANESDETAAPKIPNDLRSAFARHLILNVKNRRGRHACHADGKSDTAQVDQRANFTTEQEAEAAGSENQRTDHPDSPSSVMIEQLAQHESTGESAKNSDSNNLSGRFFCPIEVSHQFSKAERQSIPGDQREVSDAG